MCVICISKAGIMQPTKEMLEAMWKKNPHGAGYMYARSKYVYIRKGFMTFKDFYKAVQEENFTKEDTVVYHFRISTQGGVNPGMTHPFMLTDDLEKTKTLRTRTNVGICHNGIISLTSSGDPEYSDTAIFITKYLSKMVNKPIDLTDAALRDQVRCMINSRMVFLDYAGRVSTVGDFTYTKCGLIFSNMYWKMYLGQVIKPKKKTKLIKPVYSNSNRYGVI